jgi:sulfite reductase (ferredoxin)
VPYQAKLFSEFLPAEELLPTGQAIARVFAALGEKKARARARMKFLVQGMGIEKFTSAVTEERAKLPRDPRWTAYLEEAERDAEKPLREPSELDAGRTSAEFQRWHRANVKPQRQPGYSIATIFLPLGDITSDQLRGLAEVSRKYVSGTVRTTVAQNLILRWVSNADLPALHEDLKRLELALPFADTIADITACPGTDSCKLGIASSRGFAGVLHREFVNGLRSGNGSFEPRKDVSIKASGCFNSCGQHHIANIGFFGTSKRKGQRVAPVLQVILGGTTEGNAASYGLMVGKVAAQKAPDVQRRLTEIYDSEKLDGEGFNACMERLGKARIHKELEPYDLGDDEAYYHDNRQPWEYVKHVEAGECAGEMVTQAEFMLDDAERLVFEATLDLEASRIGDASEKSWKAMKSAADALLSTQGLLLSNNYDTVGEFRARFAEPGRFFPGVAEYFFKAAGETRMGMDPERTRQLLEEANLFTEEAHVVYGRMAGSVTK